jgi:membrane protease subunit HflK
MTTKSSGPRGPRVSWMAWNRPGGSSGKSTGGGGFGNLMDKLPDFGNGNPLRWIWIVLALWLAFNCFVWSTSRSAAWCCASASSSG